MFHESVERLFANMERDEHPSHSIYLEFHLAYKQITQHIRFTLERGLFIVNKANAVFRWFLYCIFTDA